jgi:hypothetical protein
MENNLEKKELEQNAKKEWVSPEMQELNLNGGAFPDPNEGKVFYAAGSVM